MFSSSKMTATPRLLQLIRVLWPEFQEKGYSTMSNREIANQMGCSKATAIKLVFYAEARQMLRREICWEGIASRKIYILEPQDFHKNKTKNKENKQ